MNYLPDDIILYINTYSDNYKDLLNMKITCKQNYKLITNFSLTKLILNEKFLNYKSVYRCVNVDCYYDTSYTHEVVYHNNYRRYIHYHQPAINKFIINTGNKHCSYTAYTPYCYECFTKYILKNAYSIYTILQ